MPERVDRRLLEELKLVMQDDYAMILEAYLEDSERQLREMLHARQAGDVSRLCEIAHSLKGASRNVGALGVAGFCEDLEQRAERGPTSAIREALALLRKELREVREIFLATLSP